MNRLDASEHGRVRIQVSGDGLAAYLDVAAGPPTSPDVLREALDKAGVSFGIDDRRVRQISRALADPKFAIRDVVIARGVPRVVAKDGRLDLFLTLGQTIGALRDDGRMDYRERDLLIRVAMGQAVGRIVQPVSGASGRAVDNGELAVTLPKAVPAPRLGPGLALEPDGTIRATRAGALQAGAGPRLEVVDLYEHHGDVDLHSGHLRMNGALVVHGTVCRHFIAETTGDLHISGDVQQGRVTAGGRIVVGGGVLGGGDDEGRVTAAGDLRIRHALEARLSAGGALHIERDAVAGRGEAERILVEGRIVGGEWRARTELIAGAVGSRSSGAPTLLSVAAPEVDRRERARAVVERLRGRPSGRARTRRGPRGVATREKGGKASRSSLSGAADRVARAANAGRQRLVLLQRARIEVRGVLSTNVLLQLGRQTLLVEVAGRAVEFRPALDGQGILRRELSE